MIRSSDRPPPHGGGVWRLHSRVRADLVRAWRCWKVWALLVWALLLAATAWSAEAKKQVKAAPPGAAGRGADPLAGFSVKPGFRLELVAEAPMVESPVALAFDERGRLFVAEMRDYPDRRDEEPHRGRIRVLEDLDEEGKFQTSTVYADDLAWPSALACYNGGVFVAATPEILYFKDTKGDSMADVRQVIFRGFGGRTSTPAAEALLHDFNWGLDNRIHGGAAGLGGTVVSVLNPPGDRPVTLGRNDFAFDPRTLSLRTEAGPSQSGLTFDRYGRKFFSDFNRPLRTPMYDPPYVARNPFFAAPPALLDVANPATPIFRYGAAPPLKPRPAAPAPDEEEDTSTEAPASAWLTMARGCVVYRGNAFPTNYVDNAFVADPEAHVIHRFVLRERGLGVVAERAPDERQSEFVASKDNTFRPAQLVNGPDGALYIADPRYGGESGRIYRLVPEHFNRPAPPRLDQLGTYALVGLLAQPNGWHQDTAARLLRERQDPAAVGLLSNMLVHARFPFARLRALRALDGLDALQEAHLLRALRDPDEHVREQAVRLCEKYALNGGASERVWEALGALAADPALRVRYQLAFTLGDLPMPGKAGVLAELLLRDPENLWLRTAVLSSLSAGGGQFLAGLADHPRLRNYPAGRQFLTHLAIMIGVQGRMDEVNPVLAYVDRLPLDVRTLPLLVALGQGLHRTGSSLALVDRQHVLSRFFDLAWSLAMSDGAPVPQRIEGTLLLTVNPYDYTNNVDWLRLLLAPGEPPALQSVAVAGLGRTYELRVTADLIQSWSVLGPGLHDEVISALLARNERAGAVLMAIENGRIRAGELSSVHLNLLRTHPEPEISHRALALFGPVPSLRPRAVDRFLPALRLTGVASQGHSLFLARCAACHQFGSEGQPFGPPLDGVKLRGKEALFTAILEPNRTIAPNYETCLIQTKEGENLTGIIAARDAETVTLHHPNGGASVWSVLDIQSLQKPAWSLMPEGLEEGLTLQDLADLLAYLMRTPR
jgi:putative membrane-bound dehydrogenase-like protein